MVIKSPVGLDELLQEEVDWALTGPCFSSLPRSQQLVVGRLWSLKW